MGKDARYYRLQFKAPEDYEDRWITIIYIVDGTYKTLHLVAETRDVFQQWSLALQKLYAIRQGLMSGLGNFETRQSVWERQYWKGADEEGDQVLDFEDVERLCKRLNVSMTTAELKKLFTVGFFFRACTKAHLRLGSRYAEQGILGLRSVPKIRQSPEEASRYRENLCEAMYRKRWEI